MVNLRPNPDFKAHSACILGATGSVGLQTVDVLREQRIPVRMMTAGKNLSLFVPLIREFSPSVAAVMTEHTARELGERLRAEGIRLPEILWKSDEILDAVRTTDADVIFHSIAGLAGLPTALAAAESGKRIAMANKEAIIACGDMIFDRLSHSGGELIPVDSEHSAIYRCLEGHEPDDVNRLILTASGGPFHGMDARDLAGVTASEALAHPTWEMGKKITVDSATLMNKGFEIIEAVRLFGIPENRVDVVIHRQSIVHSMVEWADRTVYAELGRPDMRDCIRYALTAPRIAEAPAPSLDFAALGCLTFSEPDTKTFPLLEAARTAIRTGGTAPAGLIAADEEAVEAFLAEEIGFTEVSSFVVETLGKIAVYWDINADTAAYTASEARRICRGLIEHSKRV
jgi:1-deoxy-D-xylulose-5-phosphate reductoisomerase